jgi:RNA polymerase sigma-70 factor (ECF subfamily)
VVYCVVPWADAARLHEALRRHFRSADEVEVIVEQRSTERRAPVPRRARAAGAPAGRDRRRIRNPHGRRVADRRSPTLPVGTPRLPPSLARAGAGVRFLERAVPTHEASEDVDTARLVVRFQAGDRDVFGELYVRYFDRVYSYLRVTLRDAHAAEDCTQQVFLQVLAALASYERRRQPFRAWLFVIVRNAAITHLRKSSRLELEDPADIARRADETNGASDPQLDPLRWISDRELTMFVERLPAAQRQAILMRFMLDLSTEEIAEILGRTPADVRQLQRRALIFLHQRMTAIGRQSTRRGPAQWQRRVTQVRVLRHRRFALSP